MLWIPQVIPAADRLRDLSLQLAGLPHPDGVDGDDVSALLDTPATPAKTAVSTDSLLPLL